MTITYPTCEEWSICVLLLASLAMMLPAQDCVIRRGSQAVSIWRVIREALPGKSGDVYMEQIKTATLPTLPTTILAVVALARNPFRRLIDVAPAKVQVLERSK